MNGDLKASMRPVSLSYRALYALLFVCALFIIVLLLPGRRLTCCPNETSGQTPMLVAGSDTNNLAASSDGFMYNGTYPLTPPRSRLILRPVALYTMRTIVMEIW